MGLSCASAALESDLPSPLARSLALARPGSPSSCHIVFVLCFLSLSDLASALRHSKPCVDSPAMAAACSPTFLTLPGSLPFDNSDLSDFGERVAAHLQPTGRGASSGQMLNAPARSLRADDFLTVPQHCVDFSLSPTSSLDVTDLFLPDISFEGSAEVRLRGAWAARGV